MTPIWSPEYHHPYRAVIVERRGDLPVMNHGQDRREVQSLHGSVPFHERVARNSGIIAPAGHDGLLWSDSRGYTPIWFEGSVLDERPMPMIEKIRTAVSRMQINYATIACSTVKTDLLHPVAIYDLDRKMVVSILDEEAFGRLFGDATWHCDPEKLPEEMDMHKLVAAGILPDKLPMMLRKDGPGTTSNGFMAWREGDRFFALHASDPRLPPVMDRLELDAYERRAVQGRRPEDLRKHPA